jgi:predicted PurR-regulated permease PerM
LVVGIIACLAALGFLLFMSGDAVIGQIQKFVVSLAVKDEWSLPAWLQGSSFQRMLMSRIPQPGKLLVAITGDQGQLVLPVILDFTQGIGNILSGGLVIFFLSIYWSINQIHFERLWLSLLPPGQRRQARGIWRTIERDLGAYIRSELIQSLLAALLLGFGYWILGSPYPTLLALLGALAWLIPVVGAPLAVFPPLLMGLQTSAQLGLLTAVYTLVVLIALQVWIEPRLVKHRSDNPILTLIILLAMADAFGLLGILMAPPLSAILQILWIRLVSRPVVLGASAQLSDLKERQAHIWEIIESIGEPPIALVASSMDRLRQLIEKAEPILQAPAEPLDPFHPPVIAAAGADSSNS